MSAQDSTRINTQAANKKLAALKLEIRDLKARLNVIEKKLGIKRHTHIDPQ